MAVFDGSIDFTLQNEGGFTIDSGGPTNWGITIPDVARFRKVHESSISVEDMKKLTVVEAKFIYKLEYWDPLRLSEIDDQNKATCIFDTGVNRGIHIGAIYAQRACNALGGALVCDGIIGARSIAAVNQVDRKAFIRHYEMLVQAGYDGIISHHPSYSIYRAGWNARARHLLTLI